MLSTTLDNRRAGAVALFMDSADGGWDRPVPAMAEGSKRTKKAELDQKPAAKAGEDHRAAAHGPAREMLAERGGAAREEHATHTNVAAIDSLLHFDQQRASMSLVSTDASNRQSAVPVLLAAEARSPPQERRVSAVRCLLQRRRVQAVIHNTEHHRFDNRRDILQANNNNTSWFPSDRIALILSTKHWQHSGKVLNTPSSPPKHIKLFENASFDTKRRTEHSRESAIFQLNYTLG